MIKFIAGIGIPGSGKTTYLKPFAEKFGYTYISSDDIMSEIAGEVQDLSRLPEVWTEVRKRIAEALQGGHTVVLDSTLSKLEDRISLIEFARENGAEKIQGVYMDTPPEQSKEQNESRERIVGESVIDKMHERLQESPADISDGFDSIIVFDGDQELKEIKLRDGDNEMRKEFKIR